MAGVAAIVSMASFEVAAPRAAGSGDGLGWMSNHDSGIVQEAAALRPLEPIATARVLATRGERDRARSGLLDYAASWRALVLRRGPGAGGLGRYVLRSRGVRALGETATALEQLGFPDDAATLREQGRALLGPPRRDPRGTMRP